MAISDGTLIGISLAATLVLCVFAGFFVGRSSWPAVTLCVVAGLGVTPIVIFAGFQIAGSIGGTHNSPIWFFFGWLLCVGLSLVFASVYRKRVRQR